MPRARLALSAIPAKGCKTLRAWRVASRPRGRLAAGGAAEWRSCRPCARGQHGCPARPAHGPSQLRLLDRGRARCREWDLQSRRGRVGSISTMTLRSRLDRRFAALKQEGRAAFIAFVTAGDPDADTAKQILFGLPAAGADVIELGMPFSDP